MNESESKFSPDQPGERSQEPRNKAFPHSGILLVDKPQTWTSHDVINFLRRRFNIKKAGHCGTLDPAATGLLVTLLGHATKLSGKLMGQDKVYSGTILLGTETDSGDLDGKILSQKDSSGVTEDELRNAFSCFVGKIMQTPPMVSAVKKDGKRLYELARSGISVEREAKEINICEFRIESFSPPHVNFYLECSKGTYVRALSTEIGQKLGCGAALMSLRRLKSGSFSAENAFTVDEMRKWSQEDLYQAILAF